MNHFFLPKLSSDLFVLHLVKANSKEDIKALHDWVGGGWGLFLYLALRAKYIAMVDIVQHSRSPLKYRRIQADRS